MYNKMFIRFIIHLLADVKIVDPVLCSFLNMHINVDSVLYNNEKKQLKENTSQNDY